MISRHRSSVPVIAAPVVSDLLPAQAPLWMAPVPSGG